MSMAKMNWQTKKLTIRERSKFIFNNDLFSDFRFVVSGVIGKCENKKSIPAHKFVLSISSPVFEAMFYGELAETKDSIELPDCDYESLLEFFRYMYSDEVGLNGGNVMGVFYLAKKYMVPSLADKCARHLRHNLDESNVFSVLKFAQKYDETNLVENCWKVIDERTTEAVKSRNGFLTIDRSLLEALVERDSLNINEVELFKAVDLWAINACKKQGLVANGSTKRTILGERVVKAIRFPTMKQEDFALVALDSKMLTAEEIVSVIKRINLVSSALLLFPETKRSGFVGEIQRCCRFGSVSHNKWSYAGSSKDCVNLCADREITLHGLRLFGEDQNSYWVDMEIKIAKNKSVLLSKAGWFKSEALSSNFGHYHGFEVFFDAPLVLKKNHSYSVEALIIGSDSMHGKNGHEIVKCCGVTITFTNSKYSGNGTSVSRGQFPDILFTV